MTKAEETLNAINGETTFLDILAEVSTGSTLTKFCQAFKLDYKLVNRWINDDADRQKRYQIALSIREDHAKDLIISELISYMKAKPSDAFERIEVEGVPDRMALKDVESMPPELQRLIAGIEYEEIFRSEGKGADRAQVHVGRMHKIKFWDKPRAMEVFMRNLGMLVDRKVIDVNKTLADIVAESMKPEEEATDVDLPSH